MVFSVHILHLHSLSLIFLSPRTKPHQLPPFISLLSYLWNHFCLFLSDLSQAPPPLLLSQPVWRKSSFFGPFWGSCTSRILFLLSQWGPIFLKLRPQFVLSWGDWFGVKECSWRKRCCVLDNNFILIKGGGVNFFNLIRFLCTLLSRIPWIGTNLTWLRNLIGFGWVFEES